MQNSTVASPSLPSLPPSLLSYLLPSLAHSPRLTHVGIQVVLPSECPGPEALRKGEDVDGDAGDAAGGGAAAAAVDAAGGTYADRSHLHRWQR